MLPGGKWHVHDGDRPQPPVVTPGTASTQDGPARPRPTPSSSSTARTSRSGTATTAGPPAGRSRTARSCPQDAERRHDHLEGRVRRLPDPRRVRHAPNPPKGSDQGRGNSGVLIMGRYEIQVLDSFDNLTYADGQASAIYGQHPPLVNASRPPGEWQTYDIIFTAPKFKDDGSVETPAYVTVLHNGVLVQNHAAPRPDGLPGPRQVHPARPEGAARPSGPRRPRPLPEHLGPRAQGRGRAIQPRRIFGPDLAPLQSARQPPPPPPKPRPGWSRVSPSRPGDPAASQLSHSNSPRFPIASPGPCRATPRFSGLVTRACEVAILKKVLMVTKEDIPVEKKRHKLLPGAATT